MITTATTATTFTTTATATDALRSRFSLLSLHGQNQQRKRRIGKHSLNKTSRTSVFVVSMSMKLALVAAYRNQPHPEKIKKGGEDAWFIKPDVKGGGCLGVCDGVGGFAEQGVDPGLYARVLAFEALKAHEVSTNVLFGGADPKSMIIQAQRNTKLPGAATMCVVEIDGDRLKAANVGDSGFKVIRDAKCVFESQPSQHYFNCPFQLAYMPLSADADDANECAEQYQFLVKEGDCVIVGSDGVFDNAFNEELEKIVDKNVKEFGMTFKAMESCAEDIVRVSRAHAEDKTYASPYSLEAEKYAKETGTKVNIPSGGGLFGNLTKMMGKGGGGGGGKMDDITVVCAFVGPTAQVQSEIMKSVELAAGLYDDLLQARNKAKGEEAKTLRTVELRKKMDQAFEESKAKQDQAKQQEANAPTEFTRAQIDVMDSATVRRLLQERGLPTSGKLERLQERLAAVKRM
jgi:protein phosphatase PTC7